MIRLLSGYIMFLLSVLPLCLSAQQLDEPLPPAAPVSGDYHLSLEFAAGLLFARLVDPGPTEVGGTGLVAHVGLNGYARASENVLIGTGLHLGAQQYRQQLVERYGSADFGQEVRERVITNETTNFNLAVPLHVKVTVVPDWGLYLKAGGRAQFAFSWNERAYNFDRGEVPDPTVAPTGNRYQYSGVRNQGNLWPSGEYDAPVFTPWLEGGIGLGSLPNRYYVELTYAHSPGNVLEYREPESFARTNYIRDTRAGILSLAWGLYLR